jgi:hypothetical protein
VTWREPYDWRDAPAGLRGRLEFADEFLRAIDDLPEDLVRVIARTLILSGGTLVTVGEALAVRPSGDLSRLKLAWALRRLASDRVVCDALLERLEGITEAPWAQLREALVGVRDEVDGAAGPGI